MRTPDRLMRRCRVHEHRWRITHARVPVFPTGAQIRPRPASILGYPLAGGSGARHLQRLPAPPRCPRVAAAARGRAGGRRGSGHECRRRVALFGRPRPEGPRGVRAPRAFVLMGRLCELEKSQIGGTTNRGASLMRAVLPAPPLPSRMVTTAQWTAARLGSSIGHPVVPANAAGPHESSAARHPRGEDPHHVWHDRRPSREPHARGRRRR